MNMNYLLVKHKDNKECKVDIIIKLLYNKNLT